jgi:protein-disulfide isomerase
MKNAVVIGTLGMAISFAMLAFGYVAGAGNAPAPVAPSATLAQDGKALDRDEIEAIVRNYLVSNPEILVEVQAALETQHEEQRRVAQLDTIKNASDRLFNADYDGLIGNPAGTVTVVEFFDYNCSYCKRALDDMEKLVAANPDLRFVMKEFPILGPDSQKAHQVSMAFRTLAPEKYSEFHKKLLGTQGRANEAAAVRVATSLGVDEAALRAEMQNPEINTAFDETYDLANRLAVTGTPSYVIGQEVVFGAMGYKVLAQKIEETRAACATATC